MQQPADIPEILPILPSASTLLYPLAITQITIEDKSALRLLDDISDSHRLLVIAAPRLAESKSAHLSDLFHVGTLARLALMRRNGKGKREIALLGLERVSIGAAVQEQPYLLARVTLKPDLEIAEDVPADEVDKVITVFEELTARSEKLPLHAEAYDLKQKTLRECVYTMAFFSQPDLEQGQYLLELDSPSARLRRLKDYLTTELERFDQEWQAAHRRVQEQTGSKIDLALDRLNTTVTPEDTFQVLSEQRSLLLNRKALDALRSHIAQKREQKAAKHWIFLLSQDLDLLERAHKQGLAEARGYLDVVGKMRESKQAVLEALKLLATVDANDLETLKTIMERQETHPFSPETFAALDAMAGQVEDPDSRRQLKAILDLLRDVQAMGEEDAIRKHMRMLNLDIDSEIDHALNVLEQYLTSQSYEEAYQTLQQNQEILLSDLVEQILKQHISERYSVGDQRSAQMLEAHRYLFEDARQRGLDAAWQTFIEDE